MLCCSAGQAIKIDCVHILCIDTNECKTKLVQNTIKDNFKWVL